VVFYSKRDKRTMISGSITIFILVGGAIAVVIGGNEPLVVRISIALPLILSSGYVLIGLLNIQYIIRNSDLYIRIGLYDKKIAIHSINRIRVTVDIIGILATSADRIEIFFGENKSILISPKKKKEFINALMVINPNIKLDVDLSHESSK
jgi:Bacterial PH domain